MILLAASCVMRKVECGDFAFSCLECLRTTRVPFFCLKLSPGAIQDAHILHLSELTEALLVIPSITFTV